MISKSGFDLLRKESKETLIKELIPIADIVTPNIHEAQAITGFKIENTADMERAAIEIYKMGPKNVLVIDVLFDGEKIQHFKGIRINTKNTHGTGCTLSSAIASNIALGYGIQESVRIAKEYINIAIEHSLEIGKGVGPTNHFYILYKKAGIINE